MTTWIRRALAALPILAVGCDLLGSGSEGGDIAQDKGVVLAENAYTLRGDTIHEIAGGQILRTCSGDTLHIDTIPTFEYGIPIEMHADSMFQFQFSAEDLPSGARRIEYYVLVREGGFQGLIGLWKWVGRGYRILAGEPSAQETTVMDSAVEASRGTHALLGYYTRYTASKQIFFWKVNYGIVRAALWWAVKPLQDRPENEMYDMDVRAVDSSTFEMRGRRTGETVWETALANGDMQYTSDVPGHRRHLHRRSPLSCPNPELPDWYLPFLRANRK